MRILIVGGTGKIGQAVANELSKSHDIIIAGHSQGDLKVDITDELSIENMYKKVGQIDALVSTTGSVHFGLLSEMNHALYSIGLNHKLMGQVNLVLHGIAYIKDGGSFTLTSGILNRVPTTFGSSAAMVNGAIDGFVRAAAIELPRGLRINGVSPTILEESIKKYGHLFDGYVAVSAEDVARIYIQSVEGAQTGQIYCVEEPPEKN